MRNIGLTLAAAAASIAGTAPAFAQAATGPDFTSLTNSVSPTTLVTGLLAVGAVMIGPRLARMGINWIKGSVK
ncbi:hypothetical protein [Sphingomonas sp. CV7422]|uniref:hypothetical protein n=1 Tax=Sphingomonas sp. CV7422 TaxID=3018036 RepID=UPI0022FE4DE5|nr:hypothetical protein [Sphingomonas sp. CV7422]